MEDEDKIKAIGINKNKFHSLTNIYEGPPGSPD